jgi:hypothetical protein
MVPCDVCGKEFPSKAAVNGHKMTHIPPTPCPECGRDNFKTNIAMARHRTMEHGITPGYKKKGTNPIGRPRKEIDHEWRVEDIFAAVLSILYPKGAVPIQAIPALISWREDTQRMLEKVMHD